MAPGATGNTILDNDATGNGTDCQQFLPTSGAGGGALPNAWSSNLGNVDSPSDLCTDAPISPIPGSPT